MADFEYGVDGTFLTPQNTQVYLLQPRCWSSLEIETPDGNTHAEIVEDDIIVSMVRTGFHFIDMGAPTDGYKQWYVFKAMENLDAEITSFYDELGA